MSSIQPGLREEAVVRQSPNGKESAQKPTPRLIGCPSPALTDQGNAERLVARHGRDLRYCFPQRQWYVWDGRCWGRDETGEVERRAKKTVKSIYVEAAEAESEGLSSDLAKHASKSGSAPRIRYMIELSRSEPGVAVLPEELDSGPFLLNVRNGTLDLRTGQLRDHRREDLITRCLGVPYDETAKAEHWQKFIVDVMGGSFELADFLRRAVGYSLTGDIREHVLFFLHGDGANGKSTFLNTVLALLGSYGRQLEPDILMVSRNERHPTGLADLQSTRFAVGMEIEDGRRLHESLVKQMTGGDRMTARRMRQDNREFWPTHKLWLAANNRPQISGTDNGIWRRILLLPFTVTIPKEKQDRELAAKFLEELPGILRWAVVGCLEWLRDGLQPPEDVMMATESYRKEEDVLAEFIDDMCELGDGLRIGSTDFLNAYNTWAGRPTTHKYLSARMQQRGFESLRTNKGKLWQGVSLRGEGEPS